MSNAKKDIVSIPRTQAETEQIGRDCLAYLQHLCEDYDKGNTFAVVLIAVVLRTLLKTKRQKKEELSTISVLEQLGLHTMPFVDSSLPQGSFSFWHLGDNVCNHTFLAQNVYGGLLSKHVTNGEKGLNFDFCPLLGANRNASEKPFGEWYKAIVFKNDLFQLSREDCVNKVADKDGGAHLDRNVPVEYAYFREPTALQIIVDGQVAVFNQNPVYVSIRQIAWEVLESVKRNGTFKKMLWV